MDTPNAGRQPKTSERDIKALAHAVYDTCGIWPTDKEVSLLVGGGKKRIGALLAECRAEQSMEATALFNALALLKGYTNPDAARTELQELNNKSGYERLSLSELRAIAAMRFPLKETHGSNRQELIELLTHSSAKLFLDRLHSAALDSTIAANLERRRQKMSKDERDALGDPIQEAVDAIIKRAIRN